MTPPGIAIVGVGCRLPGGVADLDGLGRLLAEGVDAVAPIPPERWDASAWNTPPAALLNVDVYGFDAAFFGIAPREAVELDPAQRLLLLCAWEALEDAGVGSVRGTRTTVYAAPGLSDYGRRRFGGPAAELTPYSGTGVFPSVASGRIAHALDLRGPAVTVDTACSSGLVAAHLAVRALRDRRCDLALVGAANLLLAPEPSVYFGRLGALAPDGRCKAFDADADGYGRGEAVVVLALRRLADAEEAGERVHAVLLGTAANHDGASTGLTAPSGRAQREVIAAALDDAGLQPDAVGLVEAHGTGTPLGDPVELEALAAVYGSVLVRSAKANLGHTEAAAGLVGLLAAVAALRAEAVPPHLHLRRQTERAGGALEIPTEPRPWGTEPRVAGVSAFGLAGTNAHAVVGLPAVRVPAPAGAGGVHLLALSARSEGALQSLSSAVAEQLATRGAASVCSAAARSRVPLPVRSCAVGADAEALAAALTEAVPLAAASPAPELVFLCTGQGVARARVGAELYRREAVFRAVIDRCHEAADLDLHALLLGDPGERVHHTDVAQPCGYALAVALAALWRSLGVVPDAVLGHSSGVLAAACIAGVYGVEDGMRLAVARGRAMGALPTGSMLAVAAGPEEVESVLRDHELDLAGINHGAEVVLSGEAERVAAAAADLEDRGVPTRALRVSHAFHSRAMEPALDAIEAAAAASVLQPPELPLYGCVDAAEVGGGICAPSWWRDQARRPVQFAAAMAGLGAEGAELFLELGAAPALCALGARCLPAARFYPSLRPDGPEAEQVRWALGGLWCAGVEVDLQLAVPEAERIDLPRYPWPLEHLELGVERVAPPAPEPVDLPAAVRQDVAAVLGLAAADALDATRGFFEQGLDSLLAVDLRDRLQARLGRPLPASLVFDHPTLDALVAHLSGSDEPVHRVPASADDVLVVGAACRLPGASDPDALWALLAEGRTALGPVPPNRFDVDRWFDPTPGAPGRLYVRDGGFLANLAGFDAAFFGMTGREAEHLDPQQRLALEVAYEALEAAAIPPSSLEGTAAGVYLGIGAGDYGRRLDPLDPGGPNPYSGTGSTTSFAAGRIAHALGLRGPALCVDTACSSSLVALHLAAEALGRGAIDVALVGGVSAIAGPERTVQLCALRALAPDGRCKTFDARADGFARAEGCAFAILARAGDAAARGLPVLARLAGTAVNHDGRSAGLTVPSGAAQRAVLAAALEASGLEPADIGFLECHGTGTSLGDPIEVGAIRSVYGDHPLWLGAIKANLGHTEAAAGLVGLLKALGALGHGAIPPQPGLGALNPELDLGPMRIPRELEPWPDAAPRRAAVSSFGLSGTNAHAVLEGVASDPAEPEEPTRPLHVLVLGARSERSLRSLAQQMGDALRDGALPDVAWSAHTGRDRHRHRLFAVARDGAEAALGLLEAELVAAGRPRVVFACAGQGGPRPGVARALYDTHPSFRAALDRCAAAVAGDRPDLLEVLLGPDPVVDTALAQPCAVALELALAALWAEWGVVPDLAVGHSVGQLAAACIAGVFSAEDAMRLAADRGALMAAQPPGAMAAVFASLEVVEAALPPGVVVAAVNAPDEVVISGPSEAVGAALAALGREHRALAVSHAFHSEAMGPVVDAFAARVASVMRREPRLGVLCTETGAILGAELCDPAYWGRHVRAPVRFAEALHGLEGAVVELGAGAVLTGMARRTLGPCVLCLPSLGPEPWRTLLAALGALHCAGVEVDWHAYDAPWRRRRVALPTYPWDHRRYWVDREPAPALHELAWVPEPLRGSAAAAPEVFDATGVSGHAAAREACLELLGRVREQVAAPARPGLVVVTRGAVGGAPAAPEQATLWGLVRVLQREHPELRARLIDVADTDPETLAAEIRGGRAPEVALHARRLVPELVRVASLPAPPPVRSDAAYVVTGGLGGIGGAVAGWLLGRGAGYVIVVGRSGGEGPEGAVVVRADVGTPEGVEAILEAVRSTGAPLRGIVHAAGVLGDAALLHTEGSHLDACWRAKVTGTSLLHEATRDAELDLFVLCSGAAGLLGRAGQGAYASANAYLDAFAAWRVSQGLPATSVVWGPWAEVGMAARLGPAHLDRIRRDGMRPLSTASALRGLAQVLGVRGAVGVFDRDAVPEPALEVVAEADAGALVAAAARRVLGADALDDRPLSEQGLDSMLAIELKNALLDVGAEVPMALVMSGPSLAELTAAVERALETPTVEAPPSGLHPVLTHALAIAVWTAVLVGAYLASLAVWGPG